MSKNRDGIESVEHILQDITVLIRLSWPPIVEEGTKSSQGSRTNVVPTVILSPLGDRGGSREYVPVSLGRFLVSVRVCTTSLNFLVFFDQNVLYLLLLQIWIPTRFSVTSISTPR